MPQTQTQTQTQTTVELQSFELAYQLDSKATTHNVTPVTSRPSSERRLRDTSVVATNNPTAPWVPGTSSTPQEAEQAVGHEFDSLPLADGGKQAWLFLAACFLVEALIWGFPFAFGVFRSYYSTHPDFAGSQNISVIGTCAMGIMYFSAPLVIGLFRAFPRQARWAPTAGLVLTCLALALSSFATSIGGLVATQGVLYAIGGGLAYVPCIVYMDEWFIRRKGLAYGIMWSGTGLAGVIFPMLMEYLLGRFGHQTTLRLWSGLLFVVTAPVSYFIRPRIPPLSAQSHGATLRNPFKNIRFIWSRSFLLHQLANIIEALGFFLPSIYLPSYAHELLGAGALPAAASLLFVNVSSVIGCVLMGWFTDRWPAPSCLLLSSVGAAVSTLLLWGFSANLPTLYAFGAMYGLFAGSYTSAWPGVMGAVTANERAKGRGVDPVLIFGFLAAGRGIGNMVSGPLSEALIQGYPWRQESGFGYGSGYGTLIAFTGVSALLGGSSFGFHKLGWL